MSAASNANSSLNEDAELRKDIDPSMEIVRRSPPAAIVFTISAIAMLVGFLFNYDWDMDLYIYTLGLSGAILSSVFRYYYSKKIISSQMPDPKWHRLHLISIYVNAFSWCLFLNYKYATDHLIETSTLYVFIYNIGYITGATSSLFWVQRLQKTFFLLNGFLPFLIFTYKGLFVESPGQNLVFGGFFFMCTLYASRQGIQLYKDFQHRLRFQVLLKSQHDTINFVIESLPGFVLCLNQGRQFSLLSSSASKYFGNKIQSGYSIQNDDSDFSKLLAGFADSNKNRFSTEMELPTETGERWFLLTLTKTDSVETTYICHGSPIGDLVAARKKIEEDRIHAAHSARLASLGVMAGGVAHEVNNPLAIISGSLYNLKSAIAKLDIPEPEKINNRIEKANHAVYRIKNITDSLRLFSRDGSQDPLLQTPVVKIVNETLNLLNEKLKSSGAEIIVHGPEDLNVTCRSTEVTQVLASLLNNSYDAVEKSEVKRIEIIWQDIGNEISLKVIDTGHGIPDHVKDKIFDPFFTTKEPNKGAGLGLSVSKTIMDNNFARMMVDSKPGRTEFSLVFPKVLPSYAKAAS